MSSISLKFQNAFLTSEVWWNDHLPDPLFYVTCWFTAFMDLTRYHMSAAKKSQMNIVWNKGSRKLTASVPPCSCQCFCIGFSSFDWKNNTCTTCTLGNRHLASESGQNMYLLRSLLCSSLFIYYYIYSCSWILLNKMNWERYIHR